MAQLVVRNLEDDVKARLRQRAAAHGCSLEAEVRAILRAAVQQGPRPEGGLGTEIAALFKGIGLRDNEEIPELRGHPAMPAKFDEC
jgi:antitoxin FitA